MGSNGRLRLFRNLQRSLQRCLQRLPLTITGLAIRERGVVSHAAMGREGLPPSGGHGPRRGMVVGVQAPTTSAPGRSRSGRGQRATPQVSLTLLDGFAVSEDGIEARLGAAARRLVALAALRPRPLSRPQMAAGVWPHLDDTTAAASLRSTLSRLRAASPHLLQRDATQVRLGADVRVDAWELEELAVRLVDGGDAQEKVVLDRLTTVLLPDWQEDWVVFERERLRDLCLHAIEAHAARLAERRSFALAILAAHEVLRADPLRESAARTLIEIHLAQGNQAQAVRYYLDLRQRLRSALGIEPSEEMRSLVRPLLTAGAAS